MSTTRYFDEQVTRKRRYVNEALCRSVIDDPLRKQVQADGRIRFWGTVNLPEVAEPRILRVITLEDGVTVHNAFLDRGYREDEE